MRTFTCSLSDESEETAEDKQQQYNPVENDSFKDEPSADTAEESDLGI